MRIVHEGVPYPASRTRDDDWRTRTGRTRCNGHAPSVGRSAMDKVSHHVSHIGYVIRADSGKQPDPKCVFRNDIGIGQISDSAILIAAHVGLPGQVSAEEQPGPYFMGIEVPDKIIPFERCPV